MKLITVPNNAIIEYGRLWDGISPAADGPGRIYITEGLITQAPAHAKEIELLDFSRCFLMPALIDGHVHFSFPDGTVPAGRAREFLQAGVFAAREAGNKRGFLPACPPFLLLQSGCAIYQKGHYGSAMGCGAASLGEALALVDKLAAQGASQIKIVASGIFSYTSFGRVGPATFTTDELKQLVRRAKGHGLPVMAHASGDEAVRRCLEAGVDSIEHAYFLSRETLREMAARGTFWLPTLAPVDAQLSDPRLAGHLTPKMHSVISRSLARHLEMVAEGNVLGVRLVAGTDAGAPGVVHGRGLWREILLLQQAGMPAPAALQAATATAALACGLPQAGTIATGKKPYLLLLDGNPLTNLAVLENPVALLLPA
ncbi:MAG: amidohydrolase family protein [Firmicutes bacterium]|jgi:imidazolonepropionase-like amidohydrolase|nr:amidohydrolase family protein [Bacillota bacterium]